MGYIFFKNYEHLQKELTQYIYYNNLERPEMGLNGKTLYFENQNVNELPDIYMDNGDLINSHKFQVNSARLKIPVMQ